MLLLFRMEGEGVNYTLSANYACKKAPYCWLSSKKNYFFIFFKKGILGERKDLEQKSSKGKGGDS